MRINLPVINVYERNTIKSKISTQLLFGDNFKKLRDFGDWIKIKNETDGYIGFIKKNKFSQRLSKIVVTNVLRLFTFF